jgi:hypothetical protein
LAANDATKVREKFEGLVTGILGPAVSRTMADRLLESQGDWRAMVEVLAAVPSRRSDTAGERAVTRPQPAPSG